MILLWAVLWYPVGVRFKKLRFQRGVMEASSSRSGDARMRAGHERLFRRGVPADARFVMDLVRAAIGSLDGGTYNDQERADWSGRFDEQSLRRQLQDPGWEFLVDEQEGKILGVGVREGGTIRHLFVHPEASGGGIASDLLAALEEAAREEGHKSLHLESARTAVGFYKRHGYEETQGEGCGSLCRGMMKRLGPIEGRDQG